MGSLIGLEVIINFLSSHQILAYLILFFGSFFETIIGFSFFVYGEIFFLSGSILAGMGVLNIWIVILVLYAGGLLGDSTSYFLGRRYGFYLYQYFEKKIFFRRYINKKNYTKGVKFFKRYGKYSVFFARFLGPISWITPFLAGIYELDYKTFLKYDLPAVILGIGQFIVIGYFAGIHYETLLNLFFKYSFILLFIGIILLYLYVCLKKGKYISKFRKRWVSNRRKLFIITIKHFILIITTIIILFFLFLSYLSLGHSGYINSSEIQLNKSILLNNTYLNNCKNLNTYYSDSEFNVIQQINVILITDKNISNILNDNWIKNDISNKENLSLKKLIASLKNKTLPVTNIYMNNISQDIAYQYKSNSLITREHIRFWEFNNKSNASQKIYLGSISKDRGVTFKFYNYFLTPVHEIDGDIDKSRDFFYNYLSSQKNLDINCIYVQTNCSVKKSEEVEDQQYYTDGNVLLCRIK